jgi:feruloyl esterase
MMLKRAQILLCTVALALSIGAASAQAQSAPTIATTTAPTDATTAPTDPCQGIAAPSVPGTLLQSITGVSVPAGTDPDPGGSPIPNVPAHCAVSLYLTHPGANDHVLVEVWLPTSGWNGRFEGIGGSGYAAGVFDTALAPAIEGG